MASLLPTLVELAADVRERLDADARAEAFRLVADWYGRARRSGVGEMDHAIAVAPDSTDDVRWDAMLAGSTDQLCLQRDLCCPRWPFAPDRYLTTWWFMSPCVSPHPSAFVQAPSALARRPRVS